MAILLDTPGTPVSSAGAIGGSIPTNAIPATPVSATAAANTAVVVTVNGVVFQTLRLMSLSGSYNAAPTGGVLTVVVNGVTLIQADITAAGLFTIPLPDGGLVCQSGQNIVITLSAAGAAVTGRLNVSTQTGN